jgi:hypothetical protein
MEVSPMFVSVGRFHFRAMAADQRLVVVERMNESLPAAARESQGFRSLDMVQLSEDEMMTVWQWDNESDWDAAQGRIGPFIQEYVAPNLASPAERVGGDIVFQIRP